MYKYTFRDLHFSAGLHIASGGLEEKERLLWSGVVQLFDVLGIVAPNGYNLQESQSKEVEAIGAGLTLRPVREKEDMVMAGNFRTFATVL